MADPANPMIAALAPLIARVRTTDTWVKTPAGPRYHPGEALTVERLAAHLNGGPARGVCSMRPGSHETSVGVLDLDSHQGETAWADMAHVAWRVVETLELVWGAHPVAFRSSGGRGIHLYVLWPEDAPQDAWSVQQWFGDVLAPLSLRAGVGGVAAGLVEVNPKNRELTTEGRGSVGSMVVLPLSGNSEWLVADDTRRMLVPAQRELTAADWRDSRPVGLRERTVRTASAGETGDWSEGAPWRAALDALAAHEGARQALGSRGPWADCIFGVHFESGGSEAGRELAHHWSARLPGYSAEVVDKLWDSLDADGDGGRVITGGTILRLAREHAGWVAPIEVGDDFGPVARETGAADAIVKATVGGARGGPLFAPVDEDPDFDRQKDGVILGTMKNTVAALRVGRIAGARIAWDEFRGEIMVRPGEGGDEGEGWRAMDDADMVRMRIRLEAGGFKTAGKDQVRDAVVLVASENRFDSAQMWLERIGAAWDGVTRVEMSMCTYFGCADSEYARAAGRYVWTALAGRVMDPGCKADMAVIFAGAQGLRKTSAIEAIAPGPEFFVEVDLGEDEEKTVRKLRGALVAELAELSGLSTRQAGDIKKYLSRRREKWVPKYKEFSTTYDRRVVHFGTTNEIEVLADDTGERRWIPLEVSRMDVEGLTRDRDQLWAEGLALWRSGGVAWEAAERLARESGAHDAFTIDDPWGDRIAGWLAEADGMGSSAGETTGAADRSRGAARFAMSDLLSGALGFATREQSMAVQRRAGSVLKRLGYRKTVTRVDGRRAKRWTRVEPVAQDE